MNIKELSKEYAEGKALNAITTAIEEAYAKGYKDGYTQAVSDTKKNIPNELESGIEFVDLGLPSGTLWATTNIDITKINKQSLREHIGMVLQDTWLFSDTVYENFVRQIAGNALQAGSSETLKESVERSERRQKLEKQIASLQNKIRKEKQLNKQIQINAELKEIKKELEDIS